MKLLRPTWVEIDLDIIKHNIDEMRKLINNKNVKLACVVKANAYGHGAVEIAKVLEEENVDYICVAGLNEAMELRKADITSEILVMGYTPDEVLEIAIENNIALTVYNEHQCEEISEISKKIEKQAIVHIKVDTGFNRLGFKINDELPKLIEKLYNLDNIKVEGIFSHLALKDEESDQEQFERFTSLLDKINHLDIPIKHICDSIGMVAYKDYHLDMVRVGASLYGYNSRPSSMDLKPAMTFKSKFARIQDIQEGEGVSYDYSFVAPTDMKIGTVLCGYSDGIPRNLSNQGYAYVNGQKANIIGKICMDQCILDLTGIDDVNESSEVIFYGINGPELLDVANLADTNRNELLSIVSRRVARVYIKNNETYKILDYLN